MKYASSLFITFLKQFWCFVVILLLPNNTVRGYSLLPSSLPSSSIIMAATSITTTKTIVDDFLSREMGVDFLISDTTKDAIRHQLLDWYHHNRRKLPWRGDPLEDGTIPPPSSAYGTWVSEIMLQQTRVETVIPYWTRWMQKFSTIQILSEASEDDVNAMWAGLGYYRRARSLLTGAKKIVADFNGIMPSNIEQLKEIPGIGPYTAGAISSIAFNNVQPLVDGNVIRVLSRLFALKESVGSSVMDKLCWSIAGRLVHPDQPGDFNQGLMELGSMICKPTSPNCAGCPVRNQCKAHILVEYAQSIVKQEEETNRQQPTTVSDQPNPFAQFGFHAIDNNEGKNCNNNSSSSSSKRRKTDPAEISIATEKGKKTKPKITLAYEDAAGKEDEITTTDGLPLSLTFFPQKIEKKKPKEISLTVAALVTRDIDPNQDMILFVKRPTEGLLANQWELPNVILPDESSSGAVQPSSSSSSSSSSSGLSSKVIDTTMVHKKKNKKHPSDAVDFLPPSTESETPIAGTWTHIPNFLRNTLGIELIVPETILGTNFVPPNGICDPLETIDQEDDVQAIKPILRAHTITRRLLPPIVHIFSHQRHTMHVTVLHVQLTSNNENPDHKIAGTHNKITENEKIVTSAMNLFPLGWKSFCDAHREIKWMSIADITAVGVTTGCKKILHEVLKNC